MTGVPPGRQCTLPRCEREAVNPARAGSLCSQHLPANSDDGTESTSKEDEVGDQSLGAEANESGSQSAEWDEADFTAPESNVWPPAWEKREFWMARQDKMPWAPWNGSWKWSNTENWADKATVDEWVGSDPRVDGHVAILEREDDPYSDDPDPFAFIDGDDVRCPESGEVHPQFVAVLERLGITYADISMSGSGVHALYVGKLPSGYKQTKFAIDDEPWGANEDIPEIEIYDGKRVCVVTGEHVPGTPLEISPWDGAELKALLEEYVPEADKHETEGNDTYRERPDLDDYEPSTTGDETTDDVRDIFYAIKQLRPQNLPLRTRQVGTDTTGWEKWDPSTYRDSSGNDSLHSPPGESVFYDYKTGHSFGLLSLFATEQGTLSKPWHRLEGQEFWEAVEAARDTGAPIPEYEPSEDAEHHAVLPDDDNLQHATSGWDWRHAGQVREDLTIDEARERTQSAIENAYERSDRVLIEALPTMGKTTSAIKSAAETGEQITYLCPRREVMQEVSEKAKDQGLDVYVLPSFPVHCETASGEHGNDWKRKVMDWYERGATPQDIHAHAEYEFGRPLPCQEHGGQECPYTSLWRFNPDDYDVLIGHYNHAHKETVTSGRTVVFDEFPGETYETSLGHRLEPTVSAFLGRAQGLPFDDYADLMAHREDAQRRADALLWFEENELADDAELVFDTDYAHACAPLAVFTIIAAARNNLGNGWERCELPGGGVGLFNRETNQVRFLTPPDLAYTSGVVALDGTPTVDMWELSIGSRLNHRQVLADDERREYIRDVLGLNLVQTTAYMKPYSGNADYVNTDEDRALIKAVTDQHGRSPVLITTKTAEREYAEAGVLDEVAGHEHFGNLKSSNEFAEVRLGAVIGSNHYGDEYIKKWGAYAGKAVERGDGKGVELSYGEFGDRIYQHMTHHETLQAAMRFGRDGNGATVYVHTAALPNWVPIAAEGRVVKTWSLGMRQVLDAANGLGSWRTSEITDHPDVEISERQVRDHLNTLAERGYLERNVEGRGYVWEDDGLHRVNDHGEVEIEPIEGEQAVAEVSRRSSYTWEFRNCGATTGKTHPLGEERRDRTAADADRPVVTDGPPPG